MEDKIKWFFLRHGKTEGNEKQQYIGRTDQPLTPAGEEELRGRKAEGVYAQAEQALRDGALLFVSPLQRAQRTAEILFPGVPQRVIEEIREMDFGDFEGYSYRELSVNAEYQKWMASGGRIPFPNGESVESFTRRIKQGLDRIRAILMEEAGQTGTGRIRAAVVVSHGGTMMAANHLFTGEDYFSGLSDNGAMKVYKDVKDHRNIEESGCSSSC